MPPVPANRSAAKSPARRQKKGISSAIEIRGARQNNLKGFDLDVPLNQLTVITGPSGSGKSSLAFQTIYAEGQRRYVETFSPYTRQFFDRMDKPMVDAIHGIPPAIAIEQANAVKTSRSTVGSITEINDYLKLYFPKVARAVCPQCHRPVRPDSTTTITKSVRSQFAGHRLLVLFGIPVPQKTEPADFFAFLQKQGYLRVRIYGDIYRTDEPDSYRKTSLPAMVDVVQDRLEVSSETQGRLSEAVETALRFGNGQLTIVDLDTADEPMEAFSTGWHCPVCDCDLRAPTPALFNFNHPLGACPACRGFGRTIGVDLEKAIPDPGLSLDAGAVIAFRGPNYHESQTDLIRHAEARGLDTRIPFEDLAEEDQRWVLFGTQGPGGDAEASWRNDAWYGVQGFFDWLEQKVYKMHVRVFLSRFRSYTTCRSCQGGRLQPEALCFDYQGKTLPALWQLPIGEFRQFLEKHQPDARDPSAVLLHGQILSRLQYLDHVGLGYLTLDRSTRTLSGGELQRVNLTTALGASLVNTLFVLDEPSIGLHPRDIGRLMDVMTGLRDKGNTLVVVEHEETVIRSADHLVDIGPGRGVDGGHLLHSGPVKRGPNAGQSLTFDYLEGRRHIAVPAQRRRLVPRHAIHIKQARQHNLKRVNVTIPLGVFCCVTGVSGSGKSTLIHHVLYRNLRRQRKESMEDEPGKVKEIKVLGRLDDIVMVDQSPLAKTPRSTPAVYIGVFDLIRKLFAATSEAKAKGLTAGYFSFNSGIGRCGRCAGSGYEKVEMQFLSDLYVTCPECGGKRYQPEALTVTLNGKSIDEVLQSTVDESISFFGTLRGKSASEIVRSLQTLSEVGLGYLRMGQPLNTLSGGEAQRLKLVGHLLSKDPRIRHSLLVFDEPTTGLHFDDVAMLLRVLQRLVDRGNSVVVIEHNIDVIKSADHVIDLGPDAGIKGGELVAEGTPEAVAEVAASHTGRYLRPALLGDTGKVAESPPPYTIARPAPLRNEIAIHGARENNLQNIDLAIPRDKLVVVTGLSGSGKSTLAFDILFAEGQRRFLDSMSPYARQFTQQLEKADIDLITGLPPTVAIEQRISRGGGKSTVATVTEIYHFLRLLFAKVGTQHCPHCGVPVSKQSSSAIATTVTEAARRGKTVLLAPLVKARKGFHTDVAEWAENHGYETLLVDGEWRPVAGFDKLARFKEHTIDVVIATIDGPLRTKTGWIREMVDVALAVGKGTAKLIEARRSEMRILSAAMTCPQCDRAFEELDPRLFSYNSPHGWCPSCRGYGQTAKFDTWEVPGKSSLEAELLEEMQRSDPSHGDYTTCLACEGTRLNPTARAVRLHDVPLERVTSCTVQDAAFLLDTFRFTGRDELISRDILTEIHQRLRFLDEVGLGYLGLDRSATTLSGGESQRIRLASQLGSNLCGVLYILDEPTIGLHHRDNLKLLQTLTALRDQGNSLVIVEHDEDTMRAADHIIDLGPGAGQFGGRVVGSGTLKQIQRTPESVTGRALREPMAHPVRGARRPLPDRRDPQAWLSIAGARKNNLKDVDLAIPLGRLVCISGISGSGKSSLMRGVLRPAVEAAIEKSKRRKRSTRHQTRPWKSVKGADAFAAIYEVDQSPIGKTTRSTPATYVKVFDEIRKLFAGVPTARMRGYTASRFSFNTAGGRCETCRGYGQIKMEMTFLPTSYVNCEDCQGMRYNAATLEVAYNGKNICEIMQMTIDEAADFFRSNSKIHRSLKLLSDTGTGYLQLGQPSPTLSGGEAQRIKLVTQLTRGVARAENARLRQNQARIKANLYLIEEPSIGLHLLDVQKLIDVLHRLVDDGHTVVVIEHNVDILAEADYLIDIGPEAGADGGRIVAQGPPEAVLDVKESRTAPFLKATLQPRVVTPKTTRRPRKRSAS